MGYTHYWRRSTTGEPEEAFGQLAVDTLRIIDECQKRGIKFGDWSGDVEFSKDLFNEGGFGFNGYGEESYETFAWPAVNDSGFAFCKTAREPYDIAVCAVLIRAKVHYGETVRITSDGDWGDEWVPAAELCTALFGEAVKPMADD